MAYTTVDRVPRHTANHINMRIRKETEERVCYFAEHLEAIPQRLQELDEEWDIERLLEANASSLAFVGTALGAFVDRRWLILPLLVTGFLFQHAVQGWCPPIPVLRRLGYRTAREIEIERVSLKALRGDFGEIGPTSADRDTRAGHALMAART